MRKLLIVGLLACGILTSRAQTSETRYYKSMSLHEEVPQEKAKYSATIASNADGSITTEIKNLKRNRIENRQVLKGDEPVGIWIYLTGRGPAEMNYDFPIAYSDRDCAKSINIKNYFVDDLNFQYEAPKLATGEQFYEFVGKNIVYPAKARRENIQGKVDLTFDLTKDGSIENIRVKNGVHIVLDKEAVRILRKIKLSSPPKIDGQPQTLCGSASVTFRLA